ncbi:auxin-responsive protein IAA13-like isoform X2 [Wolffia australiana]
MPEEEVHERESHGNGEEEDLELGLSLGKNIVADLRAPRNGGGVVLPWSDCCRMFASDGLPSPLPASYGSPISSASSTASSSPPLAAEDRSGLLGVSGIKNIVDSVVPSVGSQRASQMVGWPPVRAHWMNSLISPHSKESMRREDNSEKNGDGFNQHKITEHTSTMEQKGMNGPVGNSLFVKVNMDGVPIGRKVDLQSCCDYKELGMALEDMFHRPSPMDRPIWNGKSSHLLDGSSGFVLTYEDKDGDWMLAGDVPWEMFLSTVQRLRIMRSTDITGLGLLQRPL